MAGRVDGGGATSAAAKAATLVQLRSLWATRQGLTGARRADVVDIVRATGWIPTAGGQLPYVALFTRDERLSRTQIDEVVFERQALVEVATVRGTSMLVPREDVGLALRGGEPFARGRFAKLLAIGVTEREIATLSEAVLEALRAGPLDADALRARVPARLVRSLGEPGKKLGDTTTLAVALRQLQRLGKIRRGSVEKRLDGTKYVYDALRHNPLEARGVPTDDAGVAVALAERFFRWIGPATLEDFAWWAGLTQRTAAIAVRTAGIAPVGNPSTPGYLGMSTDTRALASVRPLAEHVRLVPFRDNVLAAHRSLEPFVDRPFAREIVLDWNEKSGRLGAVASLHHHAVLVNGSVGGIWEYDGATREIALRVFGSPSPTLTKAIRTETHRIERFVRGELGDLRYYAFDSDAKRRKRLMAVRGY